MNNIEEKKEFGTLKDDREKRKKVDEVENTLKVDEVSELFSCVEQNETTDVDIHLDLEHEDAVSMEDISPMFSCFDEMCSADRVAPLSPVVDDVDTKLLETDAGAYEPLELFDSFSDVAASQVQEEASVKNVDMLPEILSAALEDKESIKPIVNSCTFSLTDCEDTRNVELAADLFTALEKNYVASQEEEADRTTTSGWIDALEADNVSLLFSDLDQTEQMQAKMQAKEVMPAPVKVDSRVFVPTFPVRIDGGQRPGGRRQVVGANSDLLAGPPVILSAGPPAPIHGKSKRKTLSFVSKQPYPSISDTRRASAAKRQRDKGRFISDTQRFVSITALQK